MKEITLRETLVLFLYDQCEDVNDLSSKSCDEHFIDIMINHLSKDGTCPWKNYCCNQICNWNDKCGDDRFDIDCGKDHEEVWRDFISKNESD